MLFESNTFKSQHPCSIAADISPGLATQWWTFSRCFMLRLSTRLLIPTHRSIIHDWTVGCALDVSSWIHGHCVWLWLSLLYEWIVILLLYRCLLYYYICEIIMCSQRPKSLCLLGIILFGYFYPSFWESNPTHFHPLRGVSGVQKPHLFGKYIGRVCVTKMAPGKGLSRESQDLIVLIFWLIENVKVYKS